MIRRELRAMNTSVLVLLRASDAAGTATADTAVDLVREYETRFSRFQTESDLSRLNTSEGEDVTVSHELAVLLARALEYARLTDGIFDPVVLADLVAAGYDRSFEEVPPESESRDRSERLAYCWQDVEVDTERDVVHRPVGALIDLGGIAKGAAADAACAALGGHAGALVDLGGDIRAYGRPDDSRSWGIGLDDGCVRRAIVQVEDGAIATSSARKRRWVRDEQSAHHIIDPRWGRPADSGVLECSVLADTAEHADVAAKLGLILGVHSLYEGDEVAERLGVRGVAWIDDQNDYLATPGWRAQCA
jgi:thiamine biosynthesis lipoprotein